jgi:hypothetical protein
LDTVTEQNQLPNSTQEQAEDQQGEKLPSDFHCSPSGLGPGFASPQCWHFVEDFFRQIGLYLLQCSHCKRLGVPFGKYGEFRGNVGWHPRANGKSFDHLPLCWLEYQSLFL